MSLAGALEIGALIADTSTRGRSCHLDDASMRSTFSSSLTSGNSLGRGFF